MPSSGRVAVGFANAAHGLTHLFMLLYPTAVLGLEREFNLPYGELLSLSLGGFILFGLGALPAGWLADRWSETGMLAALLFGMGGAAIFTGLAPSPLWIAVGLAGIGLFASIYHPVGIALIVRHARKRGRALGINGVFGGVGLASGALVAGALMDAWSWRAAFIVPGVVVIAVGVLFVLAARLTGLRDTRVDAHPQPEVSGQTMVSAFLTLTVTTMMAGLIFQATSVSLPKIFAQRLNLFAGGSGALSVGGFVTVVYLGAASVQVFGGMLADRFPLKWVYVVAYLVQVPVLLVAARLFDWPLVAVCMLMVLLQNGAAPAESSLYARYSPARWRATAFGLKFVVSLGVSALGVPLVALIYDHTGGFFWLFVAMACFAGVAASVGLLLPSERSLRSPSIAAAGAAGAAGGSDD
jgi:FSR family fosmidomycin resistance protein-like MFS transporter